MAAAYNSLLHAQRPLSWGFVALSVLGHAAFFSLMLGFLGRPQTTASFAQKPIRASLVRLGKPRDPTLLPRQDIAPPPRTASAPSLVTPAKPLLPPAAKTPGSPQTDNNKSLFSAFAREGKAAQPLSGQLDGDALGDSAVQEGERYLGLVTAAVRPHYNVSAAIPENQRSKLKAELFVRIAPNGKLLEVKLVKSSGNPLFDSDIESALRRAAPFQPPPEHLKEKLRKDGIEFGFNHSALAP